MPTFATKSGHDYVVDGKALVWTPTVFDESEPTLPDVRIPFRVKLSLARDVDLDDLGGAEKISEFFDKIAPAAAPVLQEMDLMEIVQLFEAWNKHYSEFNGISLGEASLSPDTSPSISEPSNTISGSVSDCR